jgi:HSP20 family molecular chaperone IbpA
LGKLYFSSFLLKENVMVYSSRSAFSSRDSSGSGNRGGPFGTRPGHPYRTQLEVKPLPLPIGNKAEEYDTDAEDDALIEMVKEISRQECIRERKSASKLVMNTPIDPVSTTVETKEGKFLVSIPLGKDSNSEDIKLRVDEGDLYIEIKYEKFSEDGTSHLSQVFTKKVSLPEDLKGDSLKSKLTREGDLIIEAVLALPGYLPIPVIMCNEPQPHCSSNRRYLI